MCCPALICSGCSPRSGAPWGDRTGLDPAQPLPSTLILWNRPTASPRSPTEGLQDVSVPREQETWPSGSKWAA